MQHTSLKTLLWGRHLSRMLGVCGVGHRHSDPAPRIVHPVPHWYQRFAGILTIAGLVAMVHSVDATLRRAPEPSPWWDGTQAAALDTTAWIRWKADSDRREALAAGEGSAREASLAGTEKPRWAPLARPPAAVSRRRGGPLDSEGHLFQSIQVTAYSSQSSQTDSTPTLTASNTTPRPGTIALSRDLLRNFTPGAPFEFGDKLLIPGVGVFEAHDTMHPRWKGKADIWFASTAKARAWGRRTVFVTRVGGHIPTMAIPSAADPTLASTQK